MSGDKNLQGDKTHAHRQAQIAEGETSQDQRTHEPGTNDGGSVRLPSNPGAKGGSHQESEHNKHNNPGQSGHKPQSHGTAEEGA